MNNVCVMLFIFKTIIFIYHYICEVYHLAACSCSVMNLQVFSCSTEQNLFIQWKTWNENDTKDQIDKVTILFIEFYYNKTITEWMLKHTYSLVWSTQSRAAEADVENEGVAHVLLVSMWHMSEKSSRSTLNTAVSSRVQWPQADRSVWPHSSLRRSPSTPAQRESGCCSSCTDRPSPGAQRCSPETCFSVQLPAQAPVWREALAGHTHQCRCLLWGDLCTGGRQDAHFRTSDAWQTHESQLSQEQSISLLSGSEK